jgi:hypothetical protein
MHYHVTLGRRKTTVNIPAVLAEMLALKLGHEPDANAAGRAVRAWMQERLDRSADSGRIHVSQWLQAEIVDMIASPGLRRAWWEWFDRVIADGRFRERRPHRPSAPAPFDKLRSRENAAMTRGHSQTG